MDRTKTIGASIAAERTRRRVRQCDLARVLDVSIYTLSNWERGRSVIPSDKAWVIADEFQMTVDELIGRTVPCNRQR